jgi:hypothetical protein
MTRRLVKSPRPASHTIGSHTVRADSTMPVFLQALRAEIDMPLAAATGWDRREFLSFEPGASRPRQRLCRPSGAGCLGMQEGLQIELTSPLPAGVERGVATTTTCNQVASPPEDRPRSH